MGNPIWCMKSGGQISHCVVCVEMAARISFEINEALICVYIAANIVLRGKR